MNIFLDPEVRYWVLESLDSSFDQHLAQAENISALLVAMNDEIFEIRELAVSTIGRLSTLNPAYVMPSLRKTLIQFLTELEHSGMGRNKEQSARMLDKLIVSSPRLVRPYMEPILKILVPKLREAEPNPAVVVHILTAIGDLSEVLIYSYIHTYINHYFFFLYMRYLLFIIIIHIRGKNNFFKKKKKANATLQVSCSIKKYN